MATGRTGLAIGEVSALLAGGAVGSMTDGQLLDRFNTAPRAAAERAFAVLVERHGPMVLRVCRGVVRDDHAAHDAFQAAFLVLVRKARRLRVGQTLAPWLHQVAYRVALRARGVAARRHRRESGPILVEPAMCEPLAAEARDLAAAVQREVAALPDRLRAVVVLCDLEGQSHDDAARHLGWPVGTVKSRQARARDRLRARLTRRGLSPTLAVGAGRPPSLDPTLIGQMAALAAEVQAAGLGAATGMVASLTRGTLMSILMGKIKTVGLAVLGLTLVATAAGVVAAGGPETLARAVRPPMRGLVADEPPPDPVGRIYLDVHERGLIAIHPTTGAIERVPIKVDARVRVSPDGRMLAYGWDKAIWVRELARADAPPRKLLELDGAQFGTPPVWSPDSSKLIVSLGYHDKPWRFRSVRINKDGTGREELPIPGENGVQDWAPGGWVVTESVRDAPVGWQIDVMKIDGTESRRVTEGGNPWPTRLSPDGTQVLYADGTTEKRRDVDGTPEERRGIWVVGRDGRDRRKLLSIPPAESISACWSPDGRRIATVVIDKKKALESPTGRVIVLEIQSGKRAEFPLENVDLRYAPDMPDWR